MTSRPEYIQARRFGCRLELVFYLSISVLLPKYMGLVMKVVAITHLTALKNVTVHQLRTADIVHLGRDWRAEDVYTNF